MKAQCHLCFELFVQTSVISSTSCGHLFHCVCLLQWKEHFKSCPKCHSRLRSKDVVAKLFLDLGYYDDGDDEDEDTASANVNVLLHANDELHTQLGALRYDVSSLEEMVDFEDAAIDNCKSQIIELADTNTDLRIKVKKYKSRATILENENSRLVSTEMELDIVKKELENYSAFQSMLENMSSQPKKTMKSCAKDAASSKHLATYCSLLLKQLTITRNSKARIKDKLEALKRDLAVAHERASNKERQIVTASEENVSLKDSLEATKRALHSVKKKTDRLRAKVKDVASRKKSSKTSFDKFISKSLARQTSSKSSLDLDSTFACLRVHRLKRKANINVSPHRVK